MSQPTKQNHARIKSGITIAKLHTSLTPRPARPPTTAAPTKNAGSAESIRNFAVQLGSTHTIGRSSQFTQFSWPFLHGAVVLFGCLFRGSESSRMDVHQKYRLGLHWISRFMRKEPWVRAMNRLSPIHGKAILQRFGIPYETPVSWRGFRVFGRMSPNATPMLAQHFYRWDSAGNSGWFKRGLFPVFASR